MEKREEKAKSKNKKNDEGILITASQDKNLRQLTHIYTYRHCTPTHTQKSFWVMLEKRGSNSNGEPFYP